MHVEASGIRRSHVLALRTSPDPIDPRQEDAHWSRTFRSEPYCRGELDYEDYAPAYCVGYVGRVQYGGAYEDAETSLCANWVRIKGDSRLPLEVARCAMRAAWDRVAARSRPPLPGPAVVLQDAPASAHAVQLPMAIGTPAVNATAIAG